ncbi:MAG TPA: thioredoxin domain-containing protein [Solirubrobacteraceae bacterium]|nr:thioredoxin domain-containing protein [Solirubrobacteraceae bacterium]
MPRTWADPKAAQAARRTVRVPRGTLWLSTGLAATLLIATVIGAVILVSPNSSRAGQDARYDQEVSTLLAGIAQEGRTLGSPTAPVTLQVFADLEDNDSRRWVLTLLPAIIREFVRPGILKIEYRSYKTNTIPPETFIKQQTAAVAAGAQDELWNFVDTFYHEQGKEYTPYVTENYIDNIASQVPGLNIELWHKDRNDGRRSEQVVADDQEARADGIHVTPAYRLGRTGGPLKNFMGSEAITFPRQHHPTTFASAQDIAKAIKEIH